MSKKSKQYKTINKYVKATDLLKYETKPFLYGLLFSRIMPPVEDDPDPDFFWVYSSFKKSKAVLSSDFSFMDYSEELITQYNKISGYELWNVFSVTDTDMYIMFCIKNDLKVNSTDFYNLIYMKLLKESWLSIDSMNESKKEFVRGYMEPRGSIDTSARLFAQDYFYNTNFELKRIQILTDDNFIGLPMSYANFNPRNMQPQYVSGVNKRNAQFRINLLYYASEIGFANKYKALVFEKAYKCHDKTEKNGVIYFNTTSPEPNYNYSFIKNLNFYTNNIYEKILTTERIESLRRQLGFQDSKVMSLPQNRNQTIVALFDDISEDKCAICGTTETYKKANGRQAFEIHHMISNQNGKAYDNIANFVKLCSTCHSSLKKNRASKDVQIRNIITILHTNPQVFEYTSSALAIYNINDLAERIWEMLG